MKKSIILIIVVAMAYGLKSQTLNFSIGVNNPVSNFADKGGTDPGYAETGAIIKLQYQKVYNLWGFSVNVRFLQMVTGVWMNGEFCNS